MLPGGRFLAAGMVLAAGLLASAGAARPDAPASSGADAATILGIVRDTGLPDLVRLDAATLRPLSGPRVRVFDDASPSLSPDGTRAVLGNAATGSLTFVDLRRMRRVGHLWINPDGPVAATAWPSARRVLAAIVRHRVTHASSACCNRVTVVAADPVTRKLLRSTRLAADPVAIESWSGGLVFVLAPAGRVGVARVAVAGATGALRTASLRRITAGRNETARRLPGLAIDVSRGGRAFVVSAGEPIAEVDLRTLAVTYHEPERTLAGRTKDVGSGPARLARWLGNGLLAVSGEEFLRSDFTFEPAGLEVVDTVTWRARTIDPKVSWFRFAAGTLLGSREHLGLTSWSLDGHVRFRVLDGRFVERLEVVGDRAFVSLWGDDALPSSYSVVDLTSGTIVSEIEHPLPVLVAS